MNDTKYNGWTNYETWRVNLEIFDGMDGKDFEHCDGVYDLSKALQGFAEDLVGDSAPEGLAQDYAQAFISHVNWYEIAEHMAADYDTTYLRKAKNSA